MESESLIKLQDALWVDLPFFDEALVVDLRSACLSRKHANASLKRLRVASFRIDAVIRRHEGG